MGSLDLTVANNVIDALMGALTLTPSTAPIRCRLMTANGSNSVNGTELATGGNYTSGAGAPVVTFGVAVNLVSSLSTALSITNMPACTIVGLELWDSAAVPKRKWWGPIATPRVINAGDTLTFPLASILASIP